MSSHRLAVLALVGPALAACAPRVPPADLVLLNGRLVTLDGARPEAQALAARGDRIAAVGSTAEIEAHVGPGTRVLDLGGNLAVPGWIEGHGHFLSLGDTRLQLDLTGAAGWLEIVERVRRATAEAAPGEWIRGRGWHQEKWTAEPEGAVEGFPVHASLSAVSPDNPVVLTHASGHAVFVNGRALELAAVDRTTPDPPGGEILRDGDGEPTGLLRERAAELVAVARRDDATAVAAETRRRIELASAECLRHGVTTFTDAGSSFADLDALREAAEGGSLGVRLWAMVREPNPRLVEELPRHRLRGHAGHHLTVGGIKLSIDGALGSRGAWLLEPYSDLPSSTGLNLVPLETARRTAEIALEHGLQLCIHAIGDRANREVLDLYQTVLAGRSDGRELRWRIEHAQHLHPDDVGRFAELGVVASVQGIHCTSDGPWVPERLGERRSAEGAYVWRDLLESGARLVNGTDAPVESVDPIANFHASVTRRMSDGTYFHPEQRLSREEALRSMTLDAAYGIFEEDLKGSLTPGKLADVTVLSRDLLTVPDDEILDAEVLYTIVGGKLRYSRGQSADRTPSPPVLADSRPATYCTSTPRPLAAAVDGPGARLALGTSGGLASPRNLTQP